MSVKVVGINADCLLKDFLVRKSVVSTIKKSIVADCSRERRGVGGDSLFGSVCDPEVLQAVDNEKISIVITSYKAAVIPSNNPIGARPLSLSDC